MSKRKEARRRALRAAHVVTIALALGTGGCSNRDTPIDGSDGGEDVRIVSDAEVTDTAPDTMDDAMVDPDSMLADAAMGDAATDDAGSEDAMVADGGLDDGAIDDGAVDDGAVDDGSLGDGAVDDGALADALVCETLDTPECCNAAGGFWSEEDGRCFIAVPGPFVPPAFA